MIRILSIDGGGIKGLYSASILDQFEKKFGVSITDQVDFLSGTSIGGIIALGLACGKKPVQIVEFFERHGPHIFKPQNKWLKRLKKASGLFFSVYGNKALTKACQEFFGDTKMGDLATNGYPKLSVCIPTSNIIDGHNCVFKTSHHESFNRDQHYFLWQVALATSAAPYFLPVAEVEAANGAEFYIDGGLWSNNPSLVAITEALGYLKEMHEGISLDKIALFSLGNVPEPVGEGQIRQKRRGLLSWNYKLISLPLTFQAEGSHNMAKLLLELNGGKYLRIERTNLSASQKKLIGLDLASAESMALLKTLAISDAQNYTSPMSMEEGFLQKFFHSGEDKHG